MLFLPPPLLLIQGLKSSRKEETITIMEFMFDTSPPHRLILGVISSMFFWFAYYNILCLKSPSRSYEWHCRVVTLTHAVIITGMSFVFGVYFNPWLFTDPGLYYKAIDPVVINKPFANKKPLLLRHVSVRLHQKGDCEELDLSHALKKINKNNKHENNNEMKYSMDPIHN